MFGLCVADQLRGDESATRRRRRRRSRRIMSGARLPRRDCEAEVDLNGRDKT